MTILFFEDWDKYPNAIVDTKTRNNSFLRMSSLYKNMGIKNHAFILQLHDQSLQGVDPFDPNLTIDQKIDIAVECKNNFFYFVREIARSPDGSYSNPISFKANRGNMALYWLFLNHVMTILVQIRQTGKSFSIDVMMTYLLNIGCTNTILSLLTKDDTLRARNLERLKKIELELPHYLKQRTKNDIGNTEELRIKSMDNTYIGYLPNKSPKMAERVGRGGTSPIFEIDEAAYISNIAISLPAILASGTAIRDISRQQNTPYGTILATTAGKKDDPDGRYVYNLLSDSAIYSDLFLDAANVDELYKLIARNSPKGLVQVNCTFSHRQLGYTDEWLKNAMQAAKAEGDAAERDFLNMWTSGTQLSPLSIPISKSIRDSQNSDYSNEITSPYGYITRWFIKLNEIKQRMSISHYTLGVDSSDAVGGDDIAIILRDIKTGEVLAAGNYNETNLITFSEWLANWLITYENITLIIERRSTGAMIIDYLLLMLPNKGIDPFKRIYNKAVQEAEEFPERFKEISRPMFSRSADIYVRYKKLFGFATSATGATSRSELYSVTLLNAAKLTGSLVKDPKTIDQILSLVVRNGRVDHTEAGNDDLCIAWLLSFWIMSQGKNVIFYGINSRDILSLNRPIDALSDPIAKYDHERNLRLKIEIERLVEAIKLERDDYLVSRYERKLLSLANDLIEADKQSLSVDNLILTLRDERKANRNNFRRY